MSNEQRIQILKDKRDLINKVSPSFCTAKWLQTTLMLQNGYNHSCHHPSPHKIPLGELAADPRALFNSQHKKQQRQLMLAGERPQECDYCWNIEDLDTEYFSDRHYKTADDWAWDRFDEIASGDANANVYPSYLEVSFSNACNFKCVYCSPEISSRWLDEIKEHGPYPIDNAGHSLDYLKQVDKYPYKHSDDNPYVTAFWKVFPDALPKLRVFRITGGEPLMSKDTWQVLDYIKHNPQPDLILAVNTNLGVEDRLIDRFITAVNDLKDSVKRIDVYTSLESTGPQAEYARYGLNYAAWSANIRKVLDQTAVTVPIMTTINVLSLPTFNTFIDAIMQLRAEYNMDFASNRIPLSINYLRWPQHLSVKILDAEDRHAYSNSIRTHSETWLKYHSTEKYARLYLEEWDQIQRFCEYLVQSESSTQARTDFVKFVNEADRRRDTNFINTFPEYAKLLNA